MVFFTVGFLKPPEILEIEGFHELQGVSDEDSYFAVRKDFMKTSCLFMLVLCTASSEALFGPERNLSIRFGGFDPFGYPPTADGR